MSGGGAETSAKGIQAVVVTGRGRCGRDVDDGSGGGTYGGRGGYRQDRDGDGLNQWEYNVANITLGTEPNAPLAYAPVLKHHHPIMNTLGDPGGRLKIEKEIEARIYNPERRRDLFPFSGEKV